MDAPKALRAEMKSRNLTSVALARLVGVTPTMVSLWLNGHHRPRVDFAMRIQEQTGVPMTAWANPAPPIGKRRRNRAA